MKLSPTQLLALTLAVEMPLCRWSGGFWVPATSATSTGGKHPSGSAVPERYVGLSTIDNLERRGLLERCHRSESGIAVEEWRDPRRLTAKGAEAFIHDHLRREFVGCKITPELMEKVSAKLAALLPVPIPPDFDISTDPETGVISITVRSI